MFVGFDGCYFAIRRYIIRFPLFFSFLSLPRVFRAIPLQTRNKMNEQRESVTPSPRKNENKKDLLLLLFFFLLEEEKESGANKLVQQLTLLMIING